MDTKKILVTADYVGKSFLGYENGTTYTLNTTQLPKLIIERENGSGWHKYDNLNQFWNDWENVTRVIPEKEKRLKDFFSADIKYDDLGKNITLVDKSGIHIQIANLKSLRITSYAADKFIVRNKLDAEDFVDDIGEFLVKAIKQKLIINVDFIKP